MNILDQINQHIQIACERARSKNWNDFAYIGITLLGIGQLTAFIIPETLVFIPLILLGGICIVLYIQFG
jgi:hypothetical protein